MTALQSRYNRPRLQFVCACSSVTDVFWVMAKKQGRNIIEKFAICGFHLLPRRSLDNHLLRIRQTKVRQNPAHFLPKCLWLALVLVGIGRHGFISDIRYFKSNLRKSDVAHGGDFQATAHSLSMRCANAHKSSVPCIGADGSLYNPNQDRTQKSKNAISPKVQ